MNGYFYRETAHGIHLYHPRRHTRQYIPLSSTAKWSIRGDRIRVKDHGLVYVYGGPHFKLLKRRAQHHHHDRDHRVGLLLDWMF